MNEVKQCKSNRFVSTSFHFTRMEYIKVARVDDVILHKRGFTIHGSLHLTTHHLIFTVTDAPSNGLREIWLCYPMISSVERKRGSALLNLINSNHDDQNDIHSSVLDQLPKLYNKEGKELNLFKLATMKISCKDFNYLSFDFEDEAKSEDVFESIMKLTCLNDVSQLYAFIYQPNSIEKPFNSWGIYNPVKEFERQGLIFNEHMNESSTTSWRVSNVNTKYAFSQTYPKTLIVPKTISDNVLIHASKYRSKQRIPTLTYFYSKNGCTITRCSQPLLGLKQTRSVQDEKLVDEIFRSSYVSKNRKNLIIDARPTANAMAQTALGAGSENLDHYPNCEKLFLGIDNIHVMRDSLNKLNDILKTGDLNKPLISKTALKKTHWLKYISLLLLSTEKLVKSLVLNNSNILIHCSDGWDRTSQVASLIQLCVDPYYRTLEGFIVLIEKDWMSFGHRFSERSGHLSSESIFHNDISNDSNHASFALKSVSNHFKKKRHLKLTSPIFHQFLDSTYQIFLQFPDRFEFNERFLRRLLYHLYSGQYGNFLYDNEYERVTNDVMKKTRSVWDYFLSRKSEFTNTGYSPSNTDWVCPNYKQLKWWWQLYGRSDEEMNGLNNEEDVSTSASLNGLELQGSIVEQEREKDHNEKMSVEVPEDNVEGVEHKSEPSTNSASSNKNLFALTPPPPNKGEISTSYTFNDTIQNPTAALNEMTQTIEKMNIFQET